MICKACGCGRQEFWVTGGIELANGLVTIWAGSFEGATKEEAEFEAIRVQSALWKGCVVHCWTT